MRGSAQFQIVSYRDDVCFIYYGIIFLRNAGIDCVVREVSIGGR